MAAALQAQVRQERDYAKSFYVGEDTKVEIQSKYGEIIVRSWELDSVKFEVLVHAEGKNSDVVRKSMNRVDVRFRQIGKVVYATTEITSGRGLLGNVMNEVSSAVGSNKLKVDYLVWLPESVDLFVENKYGDVYLADLTGDIDLNVSHGDVKAGDFAGAFTLNHSFGKGNFGTIDKGDIILRGAEFSIDKASYLSFESASSEITIDEVEKALLNSRNDKIDIDRLSDIVCEGSFTDIVIDQLIESARLDFSYGDIYLSNISKDFDAIDITGNSTDINLILDQSSYIKTFIKGAEEKMVLPSSMLTMKKEVYDEERQISLSGFVGNTNANFSELSIEAQRGDIIISIEETAILSNRK